MLTTLRLSEDIQVLKGYRIDITASSVRALNQMFFLLMAFLLDDLQKVFFFFDFVLLSRCIGSDTLRGVVEFNELPLQLLLHYFNIFSKFFVDLGFQAPNMAKIIEAGLPFVYLREPRRLSVISIVYLVRIYLLSFILRGWPVRRWQGANHHISVLRQEKVIIDVDSLLVTHSSTHDPPSYYGDTPTVLAYLVLLQFSYPLNRGHDHPLTAVAGADRLLNCTRGVVWMPALIIVHFNTKL